MQWPFRGHQPKMRPDGVRPGGPKRRKYLDDFKRGEDGEYHYDGAYIAYTGALPRKRRKRNGRLRFVVCWWPRYAHFRFFCSISAICFR